MDSMLFFLAISILWMHISTFTNVFVFASSESGLGKYNIFINVWGVVNILLPKIL